MMHRAAEYCGDCSLGPASQEPATPLPDTEQQELETGTQKQTCTGIVGAGLVTRAKKWK